MPGYTAADHNTHCRSMCALSLQPQSWDLFYQKEKKGNLSIFWLKENHNKMSFVNKICSHLVKTAFRTSYRSSVNSCRLLCTPVSLPSEIKTNEKVQDQEETFASLLRNSKFVDVSTFIFEAPRNPIIYSVFSLAILKAKSWLVRFSTP